MGRTLQTLVRDVAARGRDTVLIAFTGDGMDVWTYERLDDTVRRLAAGLLNSGLAPGSRVAIVAPNSAPVVVLRLALLAAGLVAAPLDDLGSPADIERELADSGAAMLFVARDLLPAAAGCRLAGPGRRFLLDGDLPDAPSWATLLAEERSDFPQAAPDEPCALIYTSGTTGAAKGVPLTHANLMANIDALAGGGFIDHRDRALLPLPLHHSYPFMAGLMVPLACGATVILPRGVSGPEIAEALRDGRATVMVGVPRLYEAMADGIRSRIAAAGPAGRLLTGAMLAVSIAARRRLNLRAGRVLMRPVRRRFAPALRLLACGGAHLREDVAWTLEGLGFEVLSGYGLVETASVTTYNRRGRGRIGTEGPPAPGTELRIASPDESGVGEIQIRGPHVFAGYYHDAEATRQAFTDDGWFRSGDLGRLEADGSLVVVGRSKEIIVLSGGKNVAPEEIEAALSASAVIREAAVFERGGALLALVVPDMEALKDAGTARVDELLRVQVAQSCAELAPFKRVTGYRLSHRPLPRTRIGKIQRFQLAALYDGAERAPVRGETAPDAADRGLTADPLGGRVWRLLQARFSGVELTLDTSPQLDLGVDSLGWIELAHEIESETGKAVSEDAFARMVTVRDLLRHVVGEAKDVARRSPEVSLGELTEGSSAVAFMFYCLNKALMRGAFRLKTVGAAPRGDGPFLLVANHASDIDALAVAAALPWRLFRRLWWSADVMRLYSTPVRRWFSRSLRIFPVDDRRPAESLASAEAVLERGDHLMWFAESWRSPDGRLQAFLPGVGVLAGRHLPTVVPMWIAGTFEALPRHRRWPRLVRVTVIFGDPLPADAIDRAASPEDTAATIRTYVAALEPEPQAADVPPSARDRHRPEE